MELVAIEAQHGPDCTCPVTMHVDLTLVARTPGCPGDPVRYAASRISQQIDDTKPVDGPPIVITWPAPRSNLLPVWGIAIHDHATGKPLVDVVALRMAFGSDDGWDGHGVIEVELTRLLDADGNPTGHRQPAPADDLADGKRFRTGRFLHPVAEMRVADHGHEPESRRS